VRIERFEDIKAWQEARVLVKMVYDVPRLVSSFIKYLLRKETGAKDPVNAKNSTN
jgi:hypothetical protein